MPILAGRQEAQNTKSFWHRFVDAIKHGPQSKSDTGPFMVRMDLEDDVAWLTEVIMTGNLPRKIGSDQA